MANPKAAHAASDVNGPVSRSEVIARAKTWVGQGYVYDGDDGIIGNDNYPDPQGKLYRGDCSGYISMAWHLDHSRVTYGDSYWNLADPSIATPITKEQIKPGDMMMAAGTRGHAVLFEAWADTGHTKYNGYEFGATPVSHSLNIPYPYWNDGRTFSPYRYNNIIDDVAPSRSVSVVVAAGGAMSAFVTATDGHVYTSWQTSPGSTWHSWVPLRGDGPALTGNPAVHIWAADGAMTAFATATDGHVYTSWQAFAGDGWHSWTALRTDGPALTSNPTIITASGVDSAFATATDGHVYTSWQTSPGSTWNPWTQIG
jgi:hypothetical protein